MVVMLMMVMAIVQGEHGDDDGGEDDQGDDDVDNKNTIFRKSDVITL